MEDKISINVSEKDQIVMKLLHYFITEKNYNPIVLHGVKDEIWLENMDNDYKVVRIVSNYLHNNEQLSFDLFKTKRIVKAIKKKTFNINMNVLSIYTDLGDNVNLHDEKSLTSIFIKNEDDFKKYDFIYRIFPDIDKKLSFNEKGIELFMKITDDINKKNKEEALKVEELFRPKRPVITYILIALNIAIFLYGLIFNKSDFLVNAFSTYGPYIREGEFFRLLSGAFIHVSPFHILFNMYALYMIGSQAESFFGKAKFTLIYLFSAITGSLLSIFLNLNVVSIGASGAIFGVLGAMLYFGFNFRVYLGNTLIKETVPIILINLLFGFLMPGVDNFAHIGGLIGGFLTAYALGLKNKKSIYDRVNGTILTLLYFGFLVFMNFFYIK